MTERGPVQLTDAENAWVMRVWGAVPGRDRLAAEKRELERIISTRIDLAANEQRTGYSSGWDDALEHAASECERWIDDHDDDDARADLSDWLRAMQDANPTPPTAARAGGADE